MGKLRNAALGALALFGTEAVAAEEPKPLAEEGAALCVAYNVYLEGDRDRRSGRPEDALVKSISKQLNPSGINPTMMTHCLHALVGAQLTPDSDDVSLKVSLDLPEHLLQNPPANPLPSFSRTWGSDDAQHVPADQVRQTIDAWLRETNPGPFRTAVHYSFPNMGSLPQNERQALYSTLLNISDPGMISEERELDLTFAPTANIKKIYRANEPDCVALAGNPEYLRIADKETGLVEVVNIGEADEACVPEDELDRRVQKAFETLAQKNKDLAFGVHHETPPPDETTHVRVSIFWPFSMDPKQRELWTDVVKESAGIAASYVTSYYHPQSQSENPSGNLNLIVDFSNNPGQKYQPHTYNDLTIRRGHATRDKEDSLHWGTVSAGGDHVELPFQEFPGDFNGKLKPGQELDSEVRSTIFDKNPKALARKLDTEEVKQILAAGMVQALSDDFGLQESTSVAWDSSSSSTQASRLETSVGLTHACVAMPVGDNGRELTLEAKWHLPFVNVVGNGRNAEKCTPNFGIGVVFSVAGVDVTVGTSKD
jgi:hypothetical protein